MLSETSPNVESPVPMKKPKLDEEETSRTNPGSGYSSDDNDGFEHFENKEQIEAYWKYERQLTESGVSNHILSIGCFMHVCVY